MRELPEVETLANNLNTYLKGKALQHVDVPDEKAKFDQSWFNDLEGSILKKIYRYGKELRLQFANSLTLGIDFMLHGNIHLFENNNHNRYTIAELHFKNGKGLALTDFHSNAVLKINPEDKGGVDALSKDLFKSLIPALQTKAKVKAVITNQKIVRGIGNVYADEILWEARVSPFSKGSAIPEFKIKAMANAAEKVLTGAQKHLIAKGLIGLPEGLHDFLTIYGKDGETSPNGLKINVEKKGGRCTYYTDDQVLYK